MSVALVTGASTGIGGRPRSGSPASRGWSWSWSPGARSCCATWPTSLPCKATHIAVDLTDASAPEHVRAHLEANHDGRLDLLVNNAGAAWRGSFAESGYANVRATWSSTSKRWSA